MLLTKEPLSFFVSDRTAGLFVWITIWGFFKSCYNEPSSDFRMLGSLIFKGCFLYDCYTGCLVSLLFERLSCGLGKLTQQPPLPVCFAWKMLPGSDCLTARRSKIRSEDLAARFFFILFFSASFLLSLILKQFSKFVIASMIPPYICLSSSPLSSSSDKSFSSPAISCSDHSSSSCFFFIYLISYLKVRVFLSCFSGLPSDLQTDSSSAIAKFSVFLPIVLNFGRSVSETELDLVKLVSGWLAIMGS